MNKTIKGAGIGSLIGLISGLVAKKLTNPNKDLTLKDYLMWGGGGALFGGGAGAAIAHAPKLSDEDRERLEAEKARLLKKKDSGQTRAGNIAELITWSSLGALGGKGAGNVIERMVKSGHRGLLAGLHKLRRAGHPIWANILGAPLSTVEQIAGKGSKAAVKNTSKVIGKGGKWGALLGAVLTSSWGMNDPGDWDGLVTGGPSESITSRLAEITSDLNAYK